MNAHENSRCVMRDDQPGQSPLEALNENGSSPSSVPGDRWLELDLYWFDRDDPARSSLQFWERFERLFQNVSGWKGVVLCIGWLMDYITEWRGQPEDLLPLPKHMRAERFRDPPLLGGSTEERREAWRRRVANIEIKDVAFAAWTYADLQRLATTLRDTARHHGIPDFKVGTLVTGVDHGYEGERSAFASRHPHVFDIDLQPWKAFNVEAHLGKGEPPSAAFPTGAPEGLPARKYFAAQWGAFSRAIGIDVLVLRDSMIGASIYRRRGPYGSAAPDSARSVERCSRATREMIKATKLANPTALLIGYSNGGAAVADWRINCVDLESLAKDGYLDAYIDQTWAGAWNEIGQRRHTFWNAPTLGWTYQLGFTLVHAAVLANSRVRHYPLTATFDAWEPWDAIHSVPERVRWGIWAWSHAAVKTPAGLKFPDGAYISWGNRADELLSVEEVAFLSTNLDAAARDARQTVEVLGPTLVYSRGALEWFNAHAPAEDFCEWIDEQAGGVMKWSVPILSITRAEWLSQVESDLFIIQTPVHLDDSATRTIEDLIRRGEPVLVCGRAEGGLDLRLLGLLGLTGSKRFPASLRTTDPTLGQEVPECFMLNPPKTVCVAAEGASVIYEAVDRPGLVLDEREGRSVLWWEPPEPLQLAWNQGVSDSPLEEILGSPYPFVLAARCLHRLLEKHGRAHARGWHIQRPVWIGLWRTGEGALRVLAADLEEGLDHSAVMERQVMVCLPKPLTMHSEPVELWHRQPVETSNHKLHLRVQRMESHLFSIR